MEQLRELENATAGKSATQMLEYLLTKRFPGEVAVTVSLKAASIVVLKIISDIDPSTPVIFCHPSHVFPESEKYRDEIVELFGLTNVKVMTRSDPPLGKRAFERSERLWSEGPDGLGRTRETIHFNETLAHCKCWVKAVYHERTVGLEEHPFYCYGGMVIVDVLGGRTNQLVDRFMKAHSLPYHPRVRHRKKQVLADLPDGFDIGAHF